MRATSILLPVLVLAWVALPAGETYAANPFGDALDGASDSMRDQTVYRAIPPYYGGLSRHGLVHRHSSTAAEGFARGAAALMRARGEYLLLAAHARVTATEAHRREIENRRQWIESYFHTQETNRQLRAARRGPRPSQETLERYAEAGRPGRLSPGDLDLASGRVSWPLLLLADAFAPYRAQIEALFADWVADGELSVAGSLRVAETTKGMLAELRAQIARLPSSEYMAARRFLESLACEARCLPGRFGG